MPDSEKVVSRQVPGEIKRLIRAARSRLAFERFLGGFHDALVIALVVLLVLVVLSKLTPSVTPVWWIVLTVLGGLSLVSGLLIARVGSLSDGAIAALLDERLGLKDRFTTGIHCAVRTDPFAQAALAEALDTARNPATRKRLAATFSPRMPGGSWIAPVIGIVAFILWAAVPAGDVFATSSDLDEKRALQERQSAEDTVRAVLEQIAENPELSKELGNVAEAFALDESRPDGEVAPEEARREALRKISELERRLDELVNGERGMSMEAMQEALSEMDSPESSQLKKLSDAMRKGDFSQARKALEELQEKMKDEDMSEEERKKLAEEMKKMADQLQKAAQDQEALKDALRRAGMDPALANNPQALQQAMQQNSGLNQQQMQQLQQMMNAQQSASQQLQGMSNAMNQLAKQAQSGELGKGGQQMQQALSQAEQMQQMLMQAQSAQGQCSGGAPGGQSLASVLPSKPVPGQSRPGNQGFGPNPNGGGAGNAPIQETRFSTRLQKENVALQEGGDIISRQLVDANAPVVGESSLELQAVAKKIIRSWEEGIDDEAVPSHLRDVHKHYFGELKKRIDARRGTTPAPATTEPSETETTPASADEPE